MKISLFLTVILSHSFLIALADFLPLLKPATILFLVAEAIAIIVFCQRTRHSPASLACLVGLAFALVMGA